MVPASGCCSSARHCFSISNCFSGGICATIHSPKFICLGRIAPMLPMNCPNCSSSALRVPITNNKLDQQVVRRRQCLDCGHRWFTVEMTVPDYAVGWSATHLRKPVLRVPLELSAAGTAGWGRSIIPLEHVEAKDQLEPLREANARRAAEAEAHYGM